MSTNLRLHIEGGPHMTTIRLQPVPATQARKTLKHSLGPGALPQLRTGPFPEHYSHVVPSQAAVLLYPVPLYEEGDSLAAG